MRLPAVALSALGLLVPVGHAHAAPGSPAQPPLSSAGEPDQAVVQSPPSWRERRPALALHAGWWSVEAEWRTRSGLYAAAGVPWAAAALYLLNGASWVVPLGARAGYDLALSPRWSVRGSVHGASAYGNERGKCGCDDGDPVFRVFVFAEAGVQYRAAGGLVLGAYVPLYGFNLGHRQFPPPASLAFSQVYLGYSWDR